MKKQIIKYKMEVTGVIAGMIGGWCYWYFIGCASGTCPITSSPTISTLYGGMMGWLIFSSLKKGKTEKS